MICKKILDIGCGQTYLVETNDGKLLECGDVYMSREVNLGTRPYAFDEFENPLDTEKRVMTISTMLGCPCHCTFCASRDSFIRKLSAQEMVEQVDFMIEHGINLGRNDNPNNSKEFRVLYTRMGEPMMNIENVIESIRTLIKKYPHIKIGMSTSGYGASKNGLDELLQAIDIIPHIDLQISFHSTKPSDRKILFGDIFKEQLMTLKDIQDFVYRWNKATNKKTCLNMILFDNVEYDFSYLNLFLKKEDIWLRLSPWNVIKNPGIENMNDVLKTEDVINKKPLSNEKIKNIIQQIEEIGLI